MMTIINQKWRMVIYADLLFLLLSLLKPSTLPIMIVLVLWADGMIYAAEDLESRGILFAFLIAFFGLVLGREALERFGLHVIENEFTEDLNIKAELLLALSLVCIYAGYIFSSRMTFQRKPKAPINYQSDRYCAVRQASRLLFCVTFCFLLFTVWDIISYVLKHGYIVFYTSYETSVPYVFRKIGDMCPACFFVFLATMPEKKDTDRITLMYGLYLVLTLLTGKRFPFVAGLLFLFVYYLMRNKINPGGKVWISKKFLIMLCLAAPLMMIGLYIIGQARLSRGLNSNGPFDILINFVYKQGVSINVIKRAEKYAARLPAGRYYLFGSTYENIINNVIFRKLGFPQYAGNTVFHATQGYSFQHALSYAAMGNYYLEGHGLGSCYIAEAFHDFSYAGVITVSLIYGVMFRKYYDLKDKGILWCTAAFLMMNAFLLAPRGSADGFLAELTDMTTWLVIVMIWIVSSVMSGMGIHRRTTEEKKS